MSPQGFYLQGPLTVQFMVAGQPLGQGTAILGRVGDV
jgi:hypothetical protein